MTKDDLKTDLSTLQRKRAVIPIIYDPAPPVLLCAGGVRYSSHAMHVERRLG